MIMKEVTFEALWQLLAPEGEYCRRRKVCEKRWNSYSAMRQQYLFRVLQTKKSNGEYVSVNPYYAIDDNDRPVFLSGEEQDRVRAAGIALVLVRYQGRYLVCTHETMRAYALEFIRNT